MPHACLRSGDAEKPRSDLSPGDASALTSIKAPIIGFYGGNDNRVTSTVQPTAAEMKKLGKPYESHVMEGAGHGFLKSQAQSDANAKAAADAWRPTIAFLKKHTG
jgi:carboxymethylenebutenolidase